MQEAPSPQQLEPWVVRARMYVIYAGFSWPVAAMLLNILSAQWNSATWAGIGIAFLTVVFVPIAALFSIVVPTYKARLVLAPALLLLLIETGGPGLDAESTLPMLLWTVTFTAVTMLMPQIRTIRRLYAWLFLKR